MKVYRVTYYMISYTNHYDLVLSQRLGFEQKEKLFATKEAAEAFAKRKTEAMQEIGGEHKATVYHIELE